MADKMLETQENLVLTQCSLQLMEAWHKRDRNLLQELLHEDFCFISDMIKNYCMNKEEWLELILEKFELVEFDYPFQKIRIKDGGRLASVISKLSMRLKPSYNENQSLYFVTDIWVKHDDTWKLIFRQRIASLVIR